MIVDRIGRRGTRQAASRAGGRDAGERRTHAPRSPRSRLPSPLPSSRPPPPPAGGRDAPSHHRSADVGEELAPVEPTASEVHPGELAARMDLLRARAACRTGAAPTRLRAAAQRVGTCHPRMLANRVAVLTWKAAALHAAQPSCSQRQPDGPKPHACTSGLPLPALWRHEPGRTARPWARADLRKMQGRPRHLGRADRGGPPGRAGGGARLGRPAARRAAPLRRGDGPGRRRVTRYAEGPSGGIPASRRRPWSRASGRPSRSCPHA
jgi:hypothetical protein